MAWTLTQGLQTLRRQVDEAFPDRDKASDGTVGDLVHQSGSSGHNPDLTGRAEYKDGDKLDEVRAWDMDADLRAPRVTTQQFVDHIRRLPGVGRLLRYIIFNRKIYRASAGFEPADYSGPSPHTEHVHFSGAYSQAADSDTTFDYQLEDLVSLTDADKKFITDLVNGQPAKVWSYPLEDPASTKAPKATKSAGAWVRYNDALHVSTRGIVLDALRAYDAGDDAALAELRSRVESLPATMAAALPVDQIAARLAEHLPAVSRADLEGALRSVLGSLDGTMTA